MSIHALIPSSAAALGAANAVVTLSVLLAWVVIAAGWRAAKRQAASKTTTRWSRTST